jgi:nucleoid-associated protein
MSFESMTSKVMELMKQHLDAVPLAFDGYLNLILEDRADGPRFYVFLLETESGLKIDKQLDLDTIDYLNTSRLDFALRVDLDDWQSAATQAYDSESAESKPAEAGTHYLTFLKSRSNARLGDLFAKVTGFSSGTDSDKETETLMAILAQYTQGVEAKEAAQVKQKTYDYCVDQQLLGEPVALSELSGYLDDKQPTRFATFATEKAQLEENAELRPDSRKLKRLVRLSGTGHGISLSFSSDLIQQTVLFDEKSDTLTITAIPRTLKKQLQQLLKDGGQE